MVDFLNHKKYIDIMVNSYVIKSISHLNLNVEAIDFGQILRTLGIV